MNDEELIIRWWKAAIENDDSFELLDVVINLHSRIKKLEGAGERTRKMLDRIKKELE